MRQGPVELEWRTCAVIGQGRLHCAMSDAHVSEILLASQDEWLKVYCVQCVSGHEGSLAQKINSYHPQIDALPIFQEAHRSVNGEKSTARRVMLPGYVFLFSRLPIPWRNILGMQNNIRFLSYGDGEEPDLRGDDLLFAKWAFHYGGVFGVSDAVREGSCLRIVQGPLKDLIGTVIRVDRYNRNVCLNIFFSGIPRTVWMPFRWGEQKAEAIPIPKCQENI